MLIVNRIDPFSANKIDPPSWGCNYDLFFMILDKIRYFCEST